jgi:hypothetical protein
MLSYYVQSGEHIRSSINCSARPERETYPQQDRRHLRGALPRLRGRLGQKPVCAVTSPEHLAESTVPNTVPRKDLMPAEVVDLDDAFEAITEEMKFDWPEFSPGDRIKAGLIQSTLGLLLFLALIVTFRLLHQSLIYQS